MPRCRHCGSTEIHRDANACWDEVSQAWSLLTTYDSQTCGQCGADSNNLAVWVPVPTPDSVDAFVWDVVEALEDMSCANTGDFRLFCASAHNDLTPDQAAAAWRERATG